MATDIGKAGTGAVMAVGAMWSAQAGAAISVGLSDQISVELLTWVRLMWAGAILIAFVRPWRVAFNRSALRTCLLLGVASGAMTLLYMISITKLPLGTSSALQFLGPLTVGIFRLRGKAMWWAALATIGVVCLTEPWKGTSDAYGIVLSLASGFCWAAYILLTQRAGDNVAGLRALALSVPVAALVTTFTVGIWGVRSIPLPMIWAGLGIALLFPLAPYILELLALRRVNAGTFGILMSLQPGVAVLVGFVMLGQVPQHIALLGILLVSAAGVGATRNGQRKSPPRVISSASPQCQERRRSPES